MFEQTEVIAEFKTPGEAHIALARLESEGIARVVSGDTPNAANWSLLGQMQYSSIQLAVAVADAPRARALLQQTTSEDLEDGWEAEAESSIAGWLCISCDTVVPTDQDVCPECGSGRQERPAVGDEE